MSHEKQMTTKTLEQVLDDLKSTMQDCLQNGQPLIARSIAESAGDLADIIEARPEPVAWLAWDGKGWNPLREKVEGGTCKPLYAEAAPPAIPDEKTLKRMAMAHDAEDAGQRGEPSPWTEGDLDPEWVCERIECMRAAMIAAAQEGE